MTSARVTSLQALEAFKAALARFAGTAQNALAGAETQLHRDSDWLEQQTAAWRAEVMRREELLVKAKGELTQRRYSAGQGHKRDCSEQEMAVKRAEAALQHARQKRDACRRWANLLTRELEECRTPVRHLGAVLDSDLRRAIAFLEQKLAALEKYLAVTSEPPPTT